MLYPTVVGRNIDGDGFAVSESGLALFQSSQTTLPKAAEAVTWEVTDVTSPYARRVIPVVANATSLTRFVGVYEGVGGTGANVSFHSSGMTYTSVGRTAVADDPLWVRVRGATIVKTGVATAGGPLKAGATAGFLIDDSTVHSGVNLAFQAKVMALATVTASANSLCIVVIN